MGTSGSDRPGPGIFANMASDTGWYVTANLASSVFTLGLTVLLARYLGRVELGGFGLVQSAAVLLANVLSFVGPTVILILAGRDRRAGLHRVLGVGLVATVLTATLASAVVFLDTPLRGWLPNIPAGTRLLLVAHTAAQLMFMLGNAAYRGSDRFRTSSILVFTYQVGMATGGVIGALATDTIVGALWGAFSGSAVVALAAFAREMTRSGIAFPQLQELRELLATIGLRAYIAKALEISAEFFGILYLSWVGDLRAVAAIVGGNKIAQIVSKGGGMINAVVAGKAAGQAATSQDAEDLLAIARVSSGFGGAISLPMLMMPTLIMTTFFGSSFQDTGLVLALLALAEGMRGFSSVTSGFLVGQGCRRDYVGAKAVILAVTVSATVVLGRDYGAAGVAGARAVSEAVAVGTTGVLVAMRAGSLRALVVGGDLGAAKVLRRVRRALRELATARRDRGRKD